MTTLVKKNIFVKILLHARAVYDDIYRGTREKSLSIDIFLCRLYCHCCKAAATSVSFNFLQLPLYVCYTQSAVATNRHGGARRKKSSTTIWCVWSLFGCKKSDVNKPCLPCLCKALCNFFLKSATLIKLRCEPNANVQFFVLSMFTLSHELQYCSTPFPNNRRPFVFNSQDYQKVVHFFLENLQTKYTLWYISISRYQIIHLLIEDFVYITQPYLTLIFQLGRQHLYRTIFPDIITLVSMAPGSPLSLPQWFLTK